MSELPAALATALARQAGPGTRELHQTTRRLIRRYQADFPATPGEPILGGPAESLAYAVYRMPATYAAIRAVLEHLPDRIHRPSSHLDVGGGTGAAVWAAADRWPELASQTVLEQSRPATTIGSSLAADADASSVRDAGWEHTVLGTQTPLQPADVITVCYLLGEIDDALRRHLIGQAAAQARQLVIIVEPGTMAGYRRIIAARSQLLDAGMHLIAPCPHAIRCPLQEQSQDWCHFSARISRSGLHRQIKDAELGYEDEKFSYLVATPEPTVQVPGRVLRHPRYGKGRVDLVVCQAAGSVEHVTIAKRHREQYRAARKTDWGDAWPS